MPGQTEGPKAKAEKREGRQSTTQEEYGNIKKDAGDGWDRGA